MFATMMLFAAAVALSPEKSEGQASPIGRKIESLDLRDVLGASHTLSDWKDKKLLVVAFWGNQCPLANLYAPKLAALAKEFEKSDVGFVMVNANQQDSISEIVQFARKHNLTFPILKDPTNKVADAFGAVRTPETFVLDKDRVIRYWGRVDDQFGIGFVRKSATRRDLGIAIEELLAGKQVSQSTTKTEGCYIGRVKTPSATGTVTWSKDIALLFQKRCVECHRPGEIGPFSLTNYQEAVGWTDTIREVVGQQRMPPWHADPKHGQFRNDARLTDNERKLIFDWIDQGAPLGNEKEIPPPRQFTQGWVIPKPDLVISMPKEFHVPANGTVPYKYFSVDPGFTEDKWIRASECRPGNRAVVHHIVILIQPPDGKRANSRRTENGSSWLTATAPGAHPMELPDGYAKKVPAGSKIIFQMHYTPNGVATTDLSSIGLVFADPKSVKHEVMTKEAVNPKFAIPPNAENHEVLSYYKLPRDMTVLRLFPHMHLRGKSFRYEAVFPDGKSEILLDVPHYDFAWQNSYVLAEPRTLPKGTIMKCTAHYDNSSKNLSNPDPNRTVHWGDQTWEEMMIGYFDAIFAVEKNVASSK